MRGLLSSKKYSLRRSHSMISFVFSVAMICLSQSCFAEIRDVIPNNKNNIVVNDLILKEEKKPTLHPSAYLSFPSKIFLCPKMYIFNAPTANAELEILNISRFVAPTEQVVLATAPLEEGCISSGFGMRRSRMHKGVDYHNQYPVDIFAGGDGRVVEAEYRDDYGNYVLIDHGDGIFTRYAHLEIIYPEIAPDHILKMGDKLGKMGNTSSRTIARHMHYELLQGDYNTRKKSFGLTALNIFEMQSALEDITPKAENECVSGC